MNKEKMVKISKILVIVYMALTFLNILLPDEFVIGIADLDYRLDAFQMIIRWFNFVGFLALPIAVYYDRPTFKKIAVYFSLPVIIIFMFMFKDVIKGYTSELGTGIVDIRYLPEFISNLMLNGVFRGIIFFGIALTEIATIVLLILRDYKALKFSKEDIINFVIVLPLLIATIVPIYALEGIFDSHSNIKFTFFSLAHIGWMVILVLEIFVLYRLFRNRSEEDKYILVLILALSLLVQYNQLFSSLGELTCKRMPLQLCNLASYLMLYSTISKNRGVFVFNLLMNVAGAIIAVIILDADNTNLLSKGNIHYIVEHNNVVVIPILSLLLGVFAPLKKGEFKIFFKGFTAYFILMLVVGTTFNGIYTATEETITYDAIKGEKIEIEAVANTYLDKIIIDYENKDDVVWNFRSDENTGFEAQLIQGEAFNINGLDIDATVGKLNIRDGRWSRWYTGTTISFDVEDSATIKVIAYDRAGFSINGVTVDNGPYFKCNYIFMFDPVKAEKLVPFTKALFEIDIQIGPLTIYPVIQPLIYAVLCGFGYLSYIICRKTIKEKVENKTEEE